MQSWDEGCSKVRRYEPSTAKPKNVGKKNETTGHQQAISEAKSRWNKKIDGGYFLESESKSDRIMPMLAQQYEDNKKHVYFPCGVSIKRDGVRMLAFKKNGELQLVSRKGKSFPMFGRMRKQLSYLFDAYSGDEQIIFDGELYNHDLPFKEISGITRTTKKVHENEELIHYYIFDIALVESPEMIYAERVALMNTLSKLMKNKKSLVHFVEYELADSHHDIMKAHNNYVSNGYEGIIVRDLNGKYEFDKRSKGLLKHKLIVDAEFEICGVTTGRGTESDAILFVCKWNENETFIVRPCGGIEERRKLMDQSKEFIGKFLTVCYQPEMVIGEDGNFVVNPYPEAPPRNGIGKDIRDYE